MITKSITFIITSLLFGGKCFGGGIGSDDGELIFDANRDGTAELTLNSKSLGANLIVSANAFFEGNVILGSASAPINMKLNGTLEKSTVFTSTNLTASDASFIYADPSSGDIDITLPNPATHVGRSYEVKKISATGNLFISSNVAIDDIHYGVALNQYGNVELIASEDMWHITKLYNGSANMIPTYSSDNLFAWYDGSDVTTITIDGSGNVTKWNDKSESGYHLT